MGVWGVNLYQDDVACDVKDEYINWLRVGYSNVDATNTIIENNMDFIEDEEDGPIFWFALADTQWRYGRLFDEIKEVALEYINSEVDLKRWEDDPKDYRKRKKVLEDLATKLKSPQPPEKKVGKITVIKAPWNVGDILLYKIKGTRLDSQYDEFIGKYMLLKVIGIVRSHQGSLPEEYDHEACSIAIYDWIGNYIPNMDEIENLDIIPVSRKNNTILLFNKREVKKLDIEVIGNDKKFKVRDEYTSGLGSYPHCDILDECLIIDLNNYRNKLHS